MLKFKINKSLLPMKGHYFFWNAGTAPIIPFLTIYARQLGFSSFIVGIVYTVLPFSGLLAKLLMGTVADKFRCRKAIFLLAQVITIIAFISVIFLPALPQHDNTSKAHFACDSSETMIDICLSVNDKFALDKVKEQAPVEVTCKMNCPLTEAQWDVVCKHWFMSQNCQFRHSSIDFSAHISINRTQQLNHCLYFKVVNVTIQDGPTMYPNCPLYQPISTSCEMNCDAPVLNNLMTRTDENDMYKYYQFWVLLIVYLIAWIGQAVTVSVADTLCFQLLGDKPHKYGYQRMCGALGWGIISIISGFIVDALSKGEHKNYTAVFGIGIGMLLLCIIVSYKIEYTQRDISTNILKDIGELFKNVKIVVFTLWCICMGVCTALVWNFLFWLLEDLAKNHSLEVFSWIKTIEGLTMGIQCLCGELPFFFLSSWILKRIGHIHTMSLVLLVMGLRLVYYSLMTNPWWCLLIEFTAGLTFGLFYATMTSYASIVAPPGVETTTQGLVGAVFEGIGVSLGSFIAGLSIEKFGSSKTFRIFGIFALVASLLHGFVQYIIQKSGKNTKDSPGGYALPRDTIYVFDEDL